MGPGTYEVPGAGGKSVTITRQALAFTITGGKDDWTNIYKDYDKIAARPRALFIELEAMPDGFIVPEASRPACRAAGMSSAAIPPRTASSSWAVPATTRPS